MISKEQSITLQRLVCTLVAASEHLGNVTAHCRADSGDGWNEAFEHQENVAEALRKFIKTITERA